MYIHAHIYIYRHCKHTTLDDIQRASYRLRCYVVKRNKTTNLEPATCVVRWADTTIGYESTLKEQDEMQAWWKARELHHSEKTTRKARENHGENITLSRVRSAAKRECEPETNWMRPAPTQMSQMMLVQHYSGDRVMS